MHEFKIKVSGFAMLATIAMLTSFSSQPAFAGGKLCKIDHVHFGVGGVQSDLISAKRDAVRAWESFTSWEYGKAWGKVSMSMDGSMNCGKAMRGGYKCTVKAKPCKDGRYAANGETLVEKMISLYQR